MNETKVNLMSGESVVSVKEGKKYKLHERRTRINKTCNNWGIKVVLEWINKRITGRKWNN